MLSQITSMAQVRIPARHDGGNGGTTGPDPCTWQSGDLFSYLQRNPQETERVDADGVTATLYARVCGPTAITYYWVRPTASAQQVAETAGDLVRQKVPAPDGIFTPNLQQGHRAVVNTPLRIGVRTQAAVSAVASVPGVTATVTAEPQTLEFLPGDGAPPVLCGIASASTPVSCSYSYRDASSIAPNGTSWPAQLRMTWAVSWTASTGATGTLPAMTTTADYAVPVGEVQALEQAR
ncbi:hypothetical protein ND748_01075 [Frankia sp. AiPs1]|uniref:hypothetical protein n=1 Tax=Frankia sp. AiPs1 TaxID=573493 RepID=UPI0020432CA2|nr:hypothetical protein [Frankia sp. AiPs1]MCM3920281.1 hypothetical protein [Frankia sp. AiPs1]